MKRSHPKKGFTLIELMVVMTIIGFLSTIGVASYSFIQVKARDTKRLSDMRTLREALDLYYDRNNYYPTSPAGGTIIGSEEAKTISIAGITAASRASEPIFLVNAPSNTLPGGVPYLYRSENSDGTACFNECQNYEISVSFESEIANYQPGPHRLTELTLEGSEGGFAVETPTFLQTYVPSASDLQLAFGTTEELALLAKQQALDKPEIQAANVIITPLSVVASIANVLSLFAAAAPTIKLGQFLLLLFSQPFLFFNRRRKETWGTVFDADTKVPIDLASVRLVDAETGHTVGAKVTDRNGRYAFTVPRGVYRLEVTKAGYSFPSTTVRGLVDDGPYLGIYHGTLIHASAGNETITVNVPMDSQKEVPSETRKILSLQNTQQLRRFLAMSGPVLSTLGVLISPTPIMLMIFLLQIFIYLAYKRLAEPPAPKTQGVVYDEATREPVERAVVRIFSLPYNKVLEMRLTDTHGRYSFYVGHGNYYLTVMKSGYEKTETSPIDFSDISRPTFIASDLPLRRMENSG